MCACTFKREIVAFAPYKLCAHVCVPDCVFARTSQVSSEEREWWLCTWILWGLCKAAKQKTPQPPVFLSVLCVYPHTYTHASTHLISVDFCPFCEETLLQSKTRESAVERHRGNWSPTTPVLSDGKRRQHLVFASFGISFLPFSLRPFVIIFYNRMSNLPLAEHRECFSSPPPPPPVTARYSLALA